MPRRNDHVWGIILAAGDGKRLKPYIRTRFNSDCPKQFCAFTGTRSMLAHTIARADCFIPLGPNHCNRQQQAKFVCRARRCRGWNNGMLSCSHQQGNDRKHPASVAARSFDGTRMRCVVIFPSDHFIIEENCSWRTLVPPQNLWAAIRNTCFSLASNCMSFIRTTVGLKRT